MDEVRRNFRRLPEPETDLLDLAYLNNGTEGDQKEVDFFFRNRVFCGSIDLFKVLEDRNRKVLDVGCGEGRFAYCLSSVVYPNPMIGVDIMPEAVERARDVFSGGLSNLSYEEGSVYDLSEMSPVGMVAIRMALHHFNDLPAALGEIWKSLVKGGIVYFKDINPEVLFSHDSVRDLYWERVEIGDDVWLERYVWPFRGQKRVLLPLSYAVSVSAAYTKQELEEAFTDAGFSVKIERNLHEETLLAGVARKI